jgi:hypothetical protein
MSVAIDPPPSRPRLQSAVPWRIPLYKRSHYSMDEMLSSPGASMPRVTTCCSDGPTSIAHPVPPPRRRRRDRGCLPSCRGFTLAPQSERETGEPGQGESPPSFWIPSGPWTRTGSTTAPTRTGSSARWPRAYSLRRAGAGAWSTRIRSATRRTACSQWNGSAGGSSRRDGRRYGRADGMLTS